MADRYDRQMRLPDLDAAAQRRLAASRVLLVGCGALGTVVAELLARAGVGELILVDRDVVEWTNLQRQLLFDEGDAAERLPKAEAARAKLGGINQDVTVHAVVDDFNADTAEAVAEGADLFLDGTDNFPTRFLLNDLAVKAGRPYIYGGAVGTTGVVYPVLPTTPGGETPWERLGLAGPCLRCLFDPPSAGGPTCETAGVLGPIATLVGSVEAAEALKLLSDNVARTRRELLSVDLWSGTHQTLRVGDAHDPAGCPCCGERRFPYLDDGQGAGATLLCGQDAVQIIPAVGSHADSGDAPDSFLQAVRDRLSSHAHVRGNPFAVEAELTDQPDPVRLTVFAGGRAIVHGVRDPARAKGLYDRYVGS